MREVDFRTLALKKAQISSTDLVKLREVLRPSNTQGLDSKYERYWGNKDFGDEWQITIGQGNGKKTIVLQNFQLFLARAKKKPYPAEVEKTRLHHLGIMDEGNGRTTRKKLRCGLPRIGLLSSVQI